MNRLKAVFVAAMLAVSSLVCAATEPVIPSFIAHKKSYEIGDLIHQLMQPEGSSSFPWAYMSNSEILWITDGYESSENGAYRAGIVRININGEVSTVLKQELNELPWTIMYVTNGAPKWGATVVSLSPGLSASECFGAKYSMCSFDVLSSLKRIGVSVEVVCKSDSFRYSNVYRLNAWGKQPMLVVVNTDGGSGGASSEVYLLIDSQERQQKKDLCAPRDG